jgi:hypothetical protein
MHRNDAKCISLGAIQHAKLGLAKPCGVRQHGLKNWLQLSRRCADDAQHFGRRSLLLQRLLQLAGAIIKLFS